MGRPKSERLVFRGGVRTPEEVADELGYSRQYVNQIEMRALRKLKRNPKVMALVRQLLEGR